MRKRTASGMMLIVLLSMLMLAISRATAQSVTTIGIGVYWDSSLMNLVGSINWGVLQPGSVENVVVYIRNEGNVPVTLSLASSNWNPLVASSYMTPVWNYTGGVLEPSGVVPVKLSLSVISSIVGIYAFSFDCVLSASGSLTASVLVATFGSITRTWIVDDDGPADFRTIQDAIDAANPEDTIYVYNGTYYEHVIVNKRVSLTGENKDTTIVDGSGTGTVIYVNHANNVEVSSFTIRNGGSGYFYPWDSGITVESSTGCSILDNRITDNNLLGIHLWESSYNTLIDNEMTNNRYNLLVNAYLLSDFVHAIGTSNTVNGKPVYYLINQNGLTIDSSTFPEVGYLGIINSTNIVVRNINLTRNGQGVLLAHTNNSRIENVDVSLNAYGVELIYSNGDTLVGNEITQNGYYGIFSLGSQNTFSRNIIQGNTYGIHIYESPENVLEGNILRYNSIGAILSSDNNLLYHNNFVNNYLQVFVPEYTNAWDDGYPSGGNYWSDYLGVDLYNGVGQDVPSRDGIGDAPYIIDSNNRDRYPLMDPWIERKVGVNVGDWVKYGNFVVEWSSDDPGANPPSDYEFWRSIEWTKTAVEAVSGTTISFEFLIYFKDGTEQSNVWDIDVDTGVGFPFYFISADLAAGYTTYAGGIGYSPGPKINETVFVEYLGTLRETNHLDLTRFYEDYFGWKNYWESYNFHWDRATGVQTEYSYQRSFETGTEAYQTAELTSFIIVDTNLLGTPSAISATLDIDSDTLNLRSKSKWITAYVQLPEGYDPEDIDASTILLNGTIARVLDPKYDFVTNSSEYLVDHNGDGVLERMVKFDRESIASWICQSVGMQSDVSLTITGELADGTPFEGTDFILIIYPSSGGGRRK